MKLFSRIPLARIGKVRIAGRTILASANLSQNGVERIGDRVGLAIERHIPVGAVVGRLERSHDVLKKIGPLQNPGQTDGEVELRTHSTEEIGPAGASLNP